MVAVLVGNHLVLECHQDILDGSPLMPVIEQVQVLHFACLLVDRRQIYSGHTAKHQI